MGGPIFLFINAVDPTRTITTRQRFVAAMRSKFAQLMKDIKEALIDLDVLALTETNRLMFNAAGLSAKQFNFPRSDQKIEAFVNWLHGKNNEYILSNAKSGIQIVRDSLVSSPTEARDSWMKTYIDSAYQQGIKRSRQELKKQGVEIDDGSLGGNPIQVAFNSMVHADRVGLIYTRAYSSLKSITGEMESAVSDVLAMGMAAGKHPIELAKLLDKTITGRGESLEITDSLGRKIDSQRRAEVLARTETIRAHHSANIGEYRAAGVMGIKIQVEYLTAGDDRVCKRCSPLDKKIFSVDEAENLIPVHPQCRCVALPHIPKDKKEEESDLNFQTFDNTLDAQKYAVKMGFAKEVNYHDIDITTANEINRAFFDNIKKVPEIKGSMGFLGSMEGFNNYYIKFIKEGQLVTTTAESKLKLGLIESQKRANAVYYDISGRFKGGMGINSSPNLVENLDKAAKSGWGTSHSGSIKALIDHEIGHLIDDLYKISNKKGFKDFYSSLSALDIRNDLSKYGSTSIKEFLAETWADYSNNPDFKDITKASLEFFEKAIKS